MRKNRFPPPAPGIKIATNGAGSRLLTPLFTQEAEVTKEGECQNTAWQWIRARGSKKNLTARVKSWETSCRPLQRWSLPSLKSANRRTTMDRLCCSKRRLRRIITHQWPSVASRLLSALDGRFATVSTLGTISDSRCQDRVARSSPTLWSFLTDL